MDTAYNTRYLQDVYDFTVALNARSCNTNLFLLFLQLGGDSQRTDVFDLFPATFQVNPSGFALSDLPYFCL